jgi:hypothetical protein
VTGRSGPFAFQDGDDPAVGAALAQQGRHEGQESLDGGSTRGCTTAVATSEMGSAALRSSQCVKAE